MTGTLAPLDNEQIVNIALKAAHIVDLADHVPGRVTLKISLWDLPKLAFLFDGVDLQGAPKRMPGLKDFSVNVFQGTATVDYDPSVLPPELWEQFGRIRKDPQYEPVFADRLKSVLAELSEEEQ
ncbi:MAG: hypothetical protein AB1473_23735 [Thermodesulfobacteriota bacterium]